MNYKIYPINKFAVYTTESGATIIRTRKGIVATNKPVKVIHKEDLNLEDKDNLKGAEMPHKVKITILEEMKNYEL